MFFDPLAHLGIERLGGRNIGGLARKAERADFRPYALSRTRAACDEDDRHALSNCLSCTNHQIGAMTKREFAGEGLAQPWHSCASERAREGMRGIYSRNGDRDGVGRPGGLA